jgi:hypothetical protein
MSPSKKKAAKSAAKKAGAKAKSAKSKKKAASKKKAKSAKSTPRKSAKSASKAAAKKTKAKKSTAKTTAKKAAPKKAAAKTEAKATAKTTTKKAAKASTTAKAKAKSTKEESAGKGTKPAKRARPKKPVTPTGPRHPKLGFKWACFSCGAKFYDLGKEEPICPKCEADQRERPPEDAKSTVEPPKPKVVRPMAQLLDDEEPAASREEDIRPVNKPRTENEMFDDAESDAAGLDIDDADATDAVQEPPEIDVL